MDSSARELAPTGASGAATWPQSDSQRMAELLARVEAVTGPSRELDGLVAVALSDGKLDACDKWGWVRGPAYIGEAPNVTDSFDAAEALCERVLPGWRMCVNKLPPQNPAGVWFGGVRDDTGTVDIEAYGPSAALALLAAMLGGLLAVAGASPSPPSSERESSRDEHFPSRSTGES